MNKLSSTLTKYINYLNTLEPIIDNNITINYHSIHTFYKIHNREMNDTNNKIREAVISAIINNKIPNTYYNKSNLWKQFKKKLLSFIECELFTNLPILYFNCSTKAGRKNNYDFSIVGHLKNNLKITEKVEFKFNQKNIESCPQILSLSASFNTNYGEYFYDNYLDKIIALYSLENIDKTTYLKYLYQINYNKHEWFKILYTNEKQFIDEKKKIVDQSIHDWINNYYSTIDLQSLTDKFISSQTNKKFIHFVPRTKHNINNFYLDFISSDELTLTSFHSFKKNRNNLVNTIIYNTLCNTTKIHMLLRWRNHAGILNPAWQISIDRSK